jgi:hypothetical protein
MVRSMLPWSGVAAIILCLVGFAGWIFSLPTTTAAAEAPPVPRAEAEAMLALC